MAKKYFKQGEDDICYSLSDHKDYMKMEGLSELVLFEAQRETGTGHFYCKEFGEVGEVNQSCGKQCDKYKPNNGKNGRCKHYGYCYEKTDIKLTIVNTAKEL